MYCLNRNNSENHNPEKLFKNYKNKGNHMKRRMILPRKVETKDEKYWAKTLGNEIMNDSNQLTAEKELKTAPDNRLKNLSSDNYEFEKPDKRKYQHVNYKYEHDKKIFWFGDDFYLYCTQKEYDEYSKSINIDYNKLDLNLWSGKLWLEFEKWVYNIFGYLTEETDKPKSESKCKREFW
jgi:hypothetical protein